MSTLGISWSDGLDSGGLPIDNYKVTVQQSETNYNVVENNIIAQSYTALSLLIGYTYTFTVWSVNSHGISNSS